MDQYDDDALINFLDNATEGFNSSASVFISEVLIHNSTGAELNSIISNISQNVSHESINSLVSPIGAQDIFILCLLIGGITLLMFIGKIIIDTDQMIGMSNQNSSFSRYIFSLCFSTSIMYFLFTLLEILRVGHPYIRHLTWDFLSKFNLYFSLYILPLLFIYRFIKEWNIQSKKLLYIIVTFLSFLYLIAIYYACSKSIANMLSHDEQLEALSIPGMILLGVLSGYACSMWLGTLFFSASDFGDQQSKSNKENIYLNLTELQIARYENLHLEKLVQYNPLQKAYREKNAFGILPVDNKKKLEHKKMEIDTVKGLIKDYYELYAYFKGLLKKKRDEDKELRIKKWGKRLFHYFMGGFCFYKVVTSLIRLIKGRGKSIDPITRTLHTIFPFFGIKIEKENLNFYVQIITLIFVGFLIVSNLRGIGINFIRYGEKLQRFIFRWSGFGYMPYLLAEVLLIYSISLFLMIHPNIPPALLGNIEIFETGEADKINSILTKFDFCFLISSILTFAFFGLNYQCKKDQNKSEQESKKKS